MADMVAWRSSIRHDTPTAVSNFSPVDQRDHSKWNENDIHQRPFCCQEAGLGLCVTFLARHVWHAALHDDARYCAWCSARQHGEAQLHLINVRFGQHSLIILECSKIPAVLAVPGTFVVHLLERSTSGSSLDESHAAYTQITSAAAGYFLARKNAKSAL